MQQLPRNFPPQCFRPILPFLMLLIDAARIILFLRVPTPAAFTIGDLPLCPSFLYPWGAAVVACGKWVRGSGWQQVIVSKLMASRESHESTINNIHEW
jgi:hypothetical protein